MMLQKAASRSGERVYFAVVTTLGFLVRLGWVLRVHNRPVSDFASYQAVAVGLFHGRHTTLYGYQGVGYPTFLSLIYRAAGSTDIICAKLANVVLATLTLVAIWFILKQFFHRGGPLRWSYLAITFFPHYIAYTGTLGTEVLFTGLFTAIVLLQVSRFDNRLRYPLVGILIGLAALTRSNFIAYPLLLLIIEWLHGRKLKNALVFGLISAIFMGAALSPWIYYNYRRYDRFILTSYNAGMVLFINNNSENRTGSYMNPNRIIMPTEFKKQMKRLESNLPERDQMMKKAAAGWIVKHPGQFCKLGFLRVGNTFYKAWDMDGAWTMNDIDISRQSLWRQRLYNDSYALIADLIDVLSIFSLLFMLGGLVQIVRGLCGRNTELGYGLLIPFFNTLFFGATVFVFEGQPRYIFPILFLMVAAAVSIVRTVYGRLRGEGSLSGNCHYKQY